MTVTARIFREGGEMEKIRTWRTVPDSIKWMKYNRKRSTIIVSKKPFERRMEEEMELERKMEKEK
jgi:hypothetical protein